MIMNRKRSPALEANLAAQSPEDRASVEERGRLKARYRFGKMLDRGVERHRLNSLGKPAPKSLKLKKT